MAKTKNAKNEKIKEGAGVAEEQAGSPNARSSTESPRKITTRKSSQDAKKEEVDSTNELLSSPKRRKVSDGEEQSGSSQEGRSSSPDDIPKSPNSILRSPGKNSKLPKSPTGVKFTGVEIRKYNRCHGGSAGIPHQGAYPLGLDWSYDKNVMTRSVSDFEQNKTKESTFDGVAWVTEKERKKLLENFDDRNDMTRAGSFQREKQELSQIRESRKHIGCSCKGGVACTTKKCQCVKQGVDCMNRLVSVDQIIVETYDRQPWNRRSWMILERRKLQKQM